MAAMTMDKDELHKTPAGKQPRCEARQMQRLARQRNGNMGDVDIDLDVDDAIPVSGS